MLNWRTSLGPVTGMGARPEGVRRSAGGGYGTMRGIRERRGARSAKEWSISTCRTVPLSEDRSSPRAVRQFPLGPVGESGRSNPTLCPGNRDHAPGICSMAKPRKKPKAVLPVLRPGGAGCQRK